MTSSAPGGGPEFDWAWTDQDPEWVPPEIDTTRPSPARIYDYALGGKDNFEVDRRAAEQVATVLPDFRDVARKNRAFLIEAVKAMARGGVRQFLDLGTGIPTSPNVHEIAREIHPDATVVYVDNDPIVMTHNQALRAPVDGVATLRHDARDPDAILDDTAVKELINFEQPVGVLLVAVLHFVGHDLATEIVRRFRSAMAPGSYLAISAACTDGTGTAAIKKIESVYAAAGSQVVFRSASQIAEFFEGLDLLDPGLAEVSQWRAAGTPSTLRVLAGVGRKP